eukprot:7458649-Prorocentrum_lima.AAC.1
MSRDGASAFHISRSEHMSVAIADVGRDHRLSTMYVTTALVCAFKRYAAQAASSIASPCLVPIKQGALVG